MDCELDKSAKLNKIRNETLFSRCIHQDEFCDKLMSKAHSIQNNRILNKLSRSGKVMAVDFSKIPLDNSFKLREVGRGKASTFTGFCNYHDSRIFKPIENFDYNPNNEEQNFLYAYRAFALGYYERYSAYELIKAILYEDPSKVKSELGQRFVLYNDHLIDIDKIKIIMNTNLDNARFDRITTDVLIWPNEFGIASTSMFFISNDNEGRTVNKLGSYISPFFFTIFPQMGFTYVLMGYFTKDKWMYEFIKKQIVSLTVEEQKITISNLIATYIENVFISPELWNKIPKQTKEKYYYICNKSMGREKPFKLTAYKDFNLFV